MLKKNDGQALFEFIVFLPFIVIFLNLFFNISGAINSSINQQKATRGFFFRMVQNNSFFPDYDTLRSRLGRLNTASFYAIGFAEELVDGKEPKATCYRVPSFMGRDIDSCDKVGDGSKSQFVRVYTTFGICGASFQQSGGFWSYKPESPGGCTTR